MRNSKGDKHVDHVDRLPLQLSSSRPSYDRESREAAAKLSDLRKAKKEAAKLKT